MKNPGIYILTSPSGKQYVGKDSRLPSRTKEHLSGNAPQCPAIHDAIQKYGRDAFSVEIIRYPGISQEALNAVERWQIKRLKTLAPEGYNLTEGGEGGNPSEETRQKMRENAMKQIEDGTHPFLDSEIQRSVQKKRLEDGTHHLLDGEIQRKSAKKRVADGTHNFLGENNPVHKQLEDGTHNFLDSEIQQRAQIRRDAVNKKRLEDGTHHFLDGEIARRTNKKQLEDGTHNFLDSEIQQRAQIRRDAVNKKRLEDGTHNFLDGEIQRKSAKKRVADGTHNLLGENNPSHKRVADGTHNLLGENNPIKRLSKEGKHPLTLKRLKGQWCYIIALSRFWYEIHDYTLKRRAEFLSKDIPDLSNAEQEYLF